MTSYFFACSYPLAPGSVVEPGNWGRIVRMYNTRGFGNPWILFREEVLEQVRATHYPVKPSRLDGIFLCESEEQLRDFLSNSDRPLDLAYEVVLTDESAPLHRGCLAHLDFAHQENLSTFTSKAHEYWAGDNPQQVEILTTSSIRIVARI